MSRFLFVVPPAPGHINPAVGVAQELRRRGHVVAWVAHEAVVGELLGKGATIYPAGNQFLVDFVQHLPERQRARGPASLMFAWEKVFVPLALDMVGPVRSAVANFRPDVVVSDEQAFAGGIVAHEQQIPWAVSVTSTVGSVSPVTRLPRIREWMDAQLETLLGELEMAHFASDLDPRKSPYLVLEYSTPALAGDVDRGSAPVAFVGPVISRSSNVVTFPWEWLDGYDTTVFVSIGTIAHGAGERFLRAVLEAAADQPYRVVMAGPAGLAADAPDNVLIRPHVPQLDLLAHMDAVVCHGGQNTVCEALTFGLPLICAPIRDDQPLVAQQVVAAGAGLRLSFIRAKAPTIAKTIETVLLDPSYRAAASGIAESFRAAGGAVEAADRLEALTGLSAPDPSGSVPR